MSTTPLTVQAGYIPCGGRGVLKQVNVIPGQTVNITFAGTPPFNISSTVSAFGSSPFASSWCDQLASNYTSQTYAYTFDSYVFSSTNGNATYNQTIQLPGFYVTLAAIELTSSYDNTYTLSSNYTIVNATTSAATTSKTKFKAGLMLTALLILGMI